MMSAVASVMVLVLVALFVVLVSAVVLLSYCRGRRLRHLQDCGVKLVVLSFSVWRFQRWLSLFVVVVSPVVAMSLALSSL